MAGMQVTAVDRLILQLEIQDKNAKAGLKSYDKVMGDLDKTIQKTSGNMGVARMKVMSLGMALLFGGMAIKNFSQKVISGLVTSFVTARDEGDFLANKVMAVSAAFEFLKFSIFDAFANSDMFIPIVDFIINMVNLISQFINKHPAIASFIVTFSAFGLVIGAVAMAMGQLVLLSFGLQVSLGALLISIGLISAAFAAIIAIWSTDWNSATKWLLTGFILILGVLKLIGVSILGFLATPFGIALTAIVGGLAILSDRLGGIKNAFKAVGLFILFVLANIADGIANIVIIGLNQLIKVINRIIRASNRFLGTNFSEIKFVEGLNLAGKVEDMRDKLIEQARGETEFGNIPDKPTVNNNITIEGNVLNNDIINDMIKGLTEEYLGTPNGG